MRTFLGGLPDLRVDNPAGTASCSASDCFPNFPRGRQFPSDGLRKARRRTGDAPLLPRHFLLQQTRQLHRYAQTQKKMPEMATARPWRWRNSERTRMLV